MPTTRPRHLITETDQVARAIDEAARVWPEESSRAKLLIRLVEKGREVLAADDRTRAEERRAAVERTSGVLAGAYEPGYLEHLREDWPA